MAFATAADVETRLGRDLTAAEEASAEQIIDTVTDLIVEVAGQAEADLTATYFQALAVEKVVALIVNPSGLSSESEQLGAYLHSQTFPRDSQGLFLAEGEERQVRRIANNAVSGSARVRSLAHDVYGEEAE